MTDIASIGEKLRSARHVVFLTGAGVSAESGVPTFRDRQTGLWAHFEAMDLATPEAYERDPALVWGWYQWRRSQVNQAQPNAAHRAIAAIEAKVARFTLITQNVDDLHERGGSQAVLHLHGRLAISYCERCRNELTGACVGKIRQGGAAVDPPRCACGGRYRPGVVWFGESLPQTAWRAAAAAAGECDLFFCVGTSSLVQPAASLTDLALEAGATTVQINPASTDYDQRVDVALRGPAGEVLPRLLAAAWP